MVYLNNNFIGSRAGLAIKIDTSARTGSGKRITCLSVASLVVKIRIRRTRTRLDTVLVGAGFRKSNDALTRTDSSSA
jgi:hypothetical protein